ncbi:DUF3866 family protein [Phycicoccus sonneratiae]|uniref:DUF3866 family protein n=1 Tax=Phycicoccus sonneratiae TaxID=2807628 RepID=A0ABS2CIG1_9MICO|nr:DUF3866 family protein [Phycicoccus sonneraticus]MBM6399638.1 DUF3866 family protein [Phycicoccus sonneraticus]
MMQWRAGTVVEQVRAWPGAVELAVDLEGSGERVRALAYTAVTGVPEVDERVLLNASALLRGLGTGGLAFVVARTDVLPADPEPGDGHIVKARYTPLQQMLLAVDEQDSPHHGVLADADDLGGLPVVVADLHSALPAVLAGVRRARPDARVAYVMTDGGALPAAFSRAVAGLRGAGWLAACLTVGQAFGGDHEAVTVHTGLLAARHVVGADVVVVAQGPGNVGTGTRWGYSGVAAAEALHAADVLGGRGIASLRVSGADARERHRGVSHHSRTAYGRALLTPADVPLTTLPDPDLDALVRRQVADLVASARAALTAVEVPADGLLEALEASPVGLTTMGRGLREDPAPFLAAAAAGAHAAVLSARP